jgi:peptide/nickel transport system ATP-binding protein
MNRPVLEVVDLNVWFSTHSQRVHAVQGVDLQLSSGSSVGLIGESGCGKTTLALAILGLLPANATLAGQVLFEGKDILENGERSVRPHRWVDIAMVFQGAMNALNPVRTVGRQIVEVIEYHGAAQGKVARSRMSELLGRVGLRSSVANSYPHELSGGMRQRAAIALALSCRPKVLLADEPTTAIDVIAQAQVLRLLQEISVEEHLALLFISHDLAVVAQMCDAAAVMYAGKIVERAPIRLLCDEPRHPYTAALLKATPDLQSQTKQRMAALLGSAPRLDREIVGCSFAPRCPHAFATCLKAAPRLIDLGVERQAACFLNELSLTEAKR